jgi:hypothetical protein
MSDDSKVPRGDEMPTKSALPGGSRQHVRSGTECGAVARPGGATQNSGGALNSNDEDLGLDPPRKAH